MIYVGRLGSQVDQLEHRVLDISNVIRTIALETFILFILTFILVLLVASLSSKLLANGKRVYSIDSIKPKHLNEYLLIGFYLIGHFYLMSYFKSGMTTDLVSFNKPHLIDSMKDLAVSKRIPMFTKGSCRNSISRRGECSH